MSKKSVEAAQVIIIASFLITVGIANAKINPVQLQKLIAHDVSDYARFGGSVDISGDTIVVGTNTDDTSQGSAFVFEKDASGWIQTAKLTASDGVPFGRVAISGNTIVVGAPEKDSLRGSAYVYVKPTVGWFDMIETAMLIASDGEAGDAFGRVAICGDTIAVGAAWDNSDKGSVYIFVKPSDGWINMTETAKLVTSDGKPGTPGIVDGDQFGKSVAISRNTIVAGAFGDDSSTGSAYIYEKPEEGWSNMTETAKLIASDREAGDSFGFSVAIDEDTVLISSLADDSRTGSAYVFKKPDGGWSTMTETAKLTASDGKELDMFGSDIAILRDTIVVGAHDDVRKGSIYVFEKPTIGWLGMTETVKLTASDKQDRYWFGSNVAISGDIVVVCASLDDNENGQDAGAVYIYSLRDETYVPRWELY